MNGIRHIWHKTDCSEVSCVLLQMNEVGLGNEGGDHSCTAGAAPSGPTDGPPADDATGSTSPLKPPQPRAAVLKTTREEKLGGAIGTAISYNSAGEW